MTKIIRIELLDIQDFDDVDLDATIEGLSDKISRAQVPLGIDYAALSFEVVSPDD